MAVEQHVPRMTAEEFYRAPWVPEKFVELVEGEVVQMTPAGWRHGDVALNIAVMFKMFCASRKHVHCCGDNNGFLVQRDPDTVLSPDAALFRNRARGPGPWREFSPEIAVEILSPSNGPTALAYKRHQYFAAGTEQFWLVSLEPEQVQFYFPDGRVLTAAGSEVLEGEGFATGMRINLPEVFHVQ